MQEMNDIFLHSELTGEVIHCAQTVYQTLGFGFLEKVYHNAMVLQLGKSGLEVESEKQICVYYDSEIVGEYVADIVVANKVIVEVKAVQALHPAHEVQLVNYLKATDIDVCLLLNFGKTLGIRRRIFQTAR